MTPGEGAQSTWERTILESVNDVIYCVEGDVFAGHVTFVNSQVERLLGYSPQEFLDDPMLWIRSIHPDDKPRLLETTQALMAKAEPVVRIFRVRHKDGTRFVWFEDRVVPRLGADSRVVGILGVARDITARREAEIELERMLRRLQRLDGLGRFTGGIAHDLNNIFSVLTCGCGQLLAERGGAPDSLPAALADASRRGAELTKRLLAFARGEPVPARAINLNAIAADMVTLLRRIVGVDIEIVTDLEAMPATVHGDPTQIEQVILNLAANARDAMSRGGILTIATTSGAGLGGPEIVMRVSDTGEGMDEETRRRLFEAFFTTKTDGSGLGLATVKQIVDEMGAAIAVESQPGMGTTIEIRWPSHRANHP